MRFKIKNFMDYLFINIILPLGVFCIIGLSIVGYKDYAQALPEKIENIEAIRWCKGGLDTNGQPFGYEQINGRLGVTPTDGTNSWTFDSNGRGNVVQHAHPDHGNIHFETALAASTNFTLIDLSDTTNYPHSNTNYIHIEWLRLSIDSDNTGDYEITFDFLENVDATDSDVYDFTHVSGTKKTAQNKEILFSLAPNGWICKSSSIATHGISLNDATFQTDVNQKTTLDPSTADTPSGDGDIVLITTINAGNIDVIVDIGYHSH